MRRIALLVFGATTLASFDGNAVTRDEVMVRAKAYAFHPWRCTAANLTANCSSSYKSIYTPGDYEGVPYDWGGFMSIFTFDQQIKQGYGAGSYPKDGILACTSGVDCSGYVSKCWGAGHTTTSGMSTITTPISQSQLLAGDALNDAGNHVVLYSHKLASGEPAFLEAAAYRVQYDLAGGWSYVNGFTPVRYDKISGNAVGSPLGTPQNPIAVASLPYSDSRNTTQSKSDVLDGCGASPTKKETGPEYIYKVQITQPGTLTASVSCGPGVDIDVHLYTSMNTSDCVARHDKTLSHPVDCGTYYVVADTFAPPEKPGPYTLTLSFSPSGGSCGSGPPTYNFKTGKLGGPCEPYCNGNMAEFCISVNKLPFCSRICKSQNDCSAIVGGCCATLTYTDGTKANLCVPSTFCGGTKKDGGGVTTPDVGAPVDSGTQPAGDAKTPSGDSGTNPNTEAGPPPTTEAGVPLTDAGGTDPGGDDDGGCSCTTGRGRAPTGPLALALVLMGVVFCRRRR